MVDRLLVEGFVLRFRSRNTVSFDFLRRCSNLSFCQLVPAHFQAPIRCDGSVFETMAQDWERGDSAVAEASDRAFLRSFNRQIERLGLVPKP